ncbi:hypothetical protein [Streptomyces sp. NPDC003299]
MAATPPFPTLILPIRLTIGDYSADVGTIEINAREQIGPQIAEALRAAADAYEGVTAEEVSQDAAAQ